MKSKYYILNKQSDYIHGYKENIIFKENIGFTIQDNFNF